jgi:serine/threonine-protein kinase
VEIRKVDSGWEIVNLGANGTYLEGKRISQVQVENGVIIRLARSGPNVQIHIASKNLASLRGEHEQTPTAANPPKYNTLPEIKTSTPNLDSVEEDDEPTSSGLHSVAPAVLQEEKYLSVGLVGVEPSLLLERSDSVDLPTIPEEAIRYSLSECCQRYLDSDRLFCLDCGKPLNVLSTIGDYQIVKTLQQDSLGTTQLAWRNGQTFLLQTLNPEWSEHPEAIEVFEQDAKQLLTLDYVGLPNFVDLFENGGRPYLVVESTYGQTLQQLVAQGGPLDLKTAIAWIVILCEILSYLHQQNPPILHQDLKPENLVCRPSNPAAPLTVIGFTPGRILKTAIQQGIPAYTAPEQHHGQASPQSDLYALAPILMFLLTGKSPAVFYAQQVQGFRFCPEYLPGLSPELVAILHRLTHPQMEERYDSAKDLAEVFKATAV